MTHEKKLKDLDNATAIITVCFYIASACVAWLKYPLVYVVMLFTIGVIIRSLYWYAVKRIKHESKMPEVSTRI